MNQEKETIHILITDLQPHAINQRETMPLAGKILKSIRSGKEERWHDNSVQFPGRNVAMNLGTSLWEIKKILEEKTGKTVEFIRPNKPDEPSIYPSKDIIEKVNAMIKKKPKPLTRVWRDDV